MQKFLGKYFSSGSCIKAGLITFSAAQSEVRVPLELKIVSNRISVNVSDGSNTEVFQCTSIPLIN